MAPGPGSPFSLQPMPAGDRKPKNLAEFIARVNAQNGGFRHVREDDLRKEAEAQKDGAVDSSNLDASDGSDDENDADAVGDIRAARDEILRNIEIAHRNAMLTLNFVSLLLSKETPVQAGTTLSPELREMVGIGTLGATNLSASNLSKARVQENKLVATGRKLLDINKTADSILSAASRLQKEISLETKYWAEVLAVSDGGWSVTRLPQDQQTLGVKLGFTESGSEFRASSLAPMRRAEDGSVDLDTGGLGEGSKRLLVSIEKDGKVIGRSSMPPVIPDDAPLESRVLEARNSIFAQELWHELNREGRTLLSYNVRLESSALLTCALDPHTKILFKLVTVGDKSDLGAPPESNSEDGNAQSICTLLYLLLSYGHRQSGHKRSQQQLLGANQGRAANPPFYLLRPILAYLQFESLVQRCIRFLSDLTSILQAAGVTTASYTINEPPITLASPLPPSESLLALLLNPLSFRAELTITPEARLEIVTNLFTAQHVAGSFHIGLLPPTVAGQGGGDKTEDRVAVKPEGDDSSGPDTATNPLSYAFPPGTDIYPSLEEVFNYIRQAVPRILADHYAGLAVEWTAEAAGRDGTAATADVKGSDDDIDTEQPQAERHLPEWIISIDGQEVQVRDEEGRGIRFELLAANASAPDGADGDDTGENGAVQGGADQSSRLRELRVTGDVLSEEGKTGRKTWVWRTGQAAKETLVDVVRGAIMGWVRLGPGGHTPVQ